MDDQLPRPSAPASDPQRLQRLEEHAGFTEHDLEQLSAEIAALNKRLHTLTTRVDALEERLRRMMQQPTDSADG